jgi:predicted RNA binding protein YcfA (HicA-like mRNA interferase family)
MPPFGPIKRKDLISYLRLCGFEGPYSRKKHQFMSKEALRVTIPNPHKGDISKELLALVLREAEISREEWESL